MDWFETWGLTITVFLPAVGALLLGFVKRDNEDALKYSSAIDFSWLSMPLTFYSFY